MNIKLFSILGVALAITSRCDAQTHSQQRVVVTATNATNTDSWQSTFGGGNIAINPIFNEGGISAGIIPSSGVIQTFKGDGKKLEAVGFYFTNTSAPTEGKEFTISLLDYGTEGPISKNSAQFNRVTTAVFSNNFTWPASKTGKQYYFDFSGASNVVLEDSHYYGIVLQFPDATGNQNIYRSLNEPYPDGRMMIGAIGKFDGKFGGDRDASFAVYTEGGVLAPTTALPQDSAPNIPTPADSTPQPYRGNASVPSPRGDANSILAHEQLVAKAKTGGIDLYFLGDSITRRWGSTDTPWAPMMENWKKNFFGWNAANFGWGADSIQNMLWRIQNGELDGVNPKVIVILAGTNNVGQKLGGDAKVVDIIKGIKSLVDTSQQKAPAAKIIVTGIFPRNDSMATLPEIQQINEGIAKFADGKTIFYLNINDKLAGPDGTLFEGMTVDKLHLSVKGYQVWADGLRPLLTQLLGPPATTDHAPPPTGDPSAARPAHDS